MLPRCQHVNNSLTTDTNRKSLAVNALALEEKSFIVGNMQEISEQQVERLEAGLSAARLVVEELRASAVAVAPAVQAEVDRKEAKRQCLFCGELFPLPKRYVRGLCQNCSATFRSLMERGEATETQLIQIGKMSAQKKPGGRIAKTPKPLEELRKLLAGLSGTASPVEQDQGDATKLIGVGKEKKTIKRAVRGSVQKKGGKAANGTT